MFKSIWLWRAIIWMLPALLLATAGYFVGVWGLGFGLGLIWMAVVISSGIMVLGQMEFAVMEVLGQFRKVWFKGLHFRVIGVEQVRMRGDFLAKRLELYADEAAPEMDFTDASSPIDASMWYRIGEPGPITYARYKQLADDVQKWVYAYKNPEERIYNLVDAELRPLLQSKSIDEASIDRNGIAKRVTEEILPQLREMGIYLPSEEKRLVIEDIDLPDAVIQLRELKLKGEKLAAETEAESVGYWKAIKEIADKLGVSTTEATRIYETQRGLNTLPEIKANVSLVSRDIGGVLGTINLGRNGSPA